MQAPRTLSDLVTRRTEPEAFARRQASAESVVAHAGAKGPDGPAAYESEVFNFLLKNKVRLGIQNVRDSRIASSTASLCSRMARDCPSRSSCE
jgi:hypothetical protein